MEKWTMRKTWLNILEKLGTRPAASISIWLVFISSLFAIELLLETSAHTRIVLLVAYIVHATLGGSGVHLRLGLPLPGGAATQ